MFQIKEIHHKLNAESGIFKLDSDTKYYGKYMSLEFTQEELMKLILKNLKKLNKSPCNDFKVSFNDDNALAVIQCWTGKESEMTEIELEGDRDYYNVLEYDIVYSGDVDVNIIPDEWLLI